MGKTPVTLCCVGVGAGGVSCLLGLRRCSGTSYGWHLAIRKESVIACRTAVSLSVSGTIYFLVPFR